MWTGHTRYSLTHQHREVSGHEPDVHVFELEEETGEPGESHPGPREHAKNIFPFHKCQSRFCLSVQRMSQMKGGL